MNGTINKIFLCFILCLCLWLGGLAWFVAQIPTQPMAAEQQADAIVVLTGGSLRLEYGLTLLADGKGKKLFVSGVGEDISTQALLKTAPPGISQTLAGRTQDIALGHRAVNTIGNATETARWLKKHDYRSILLVTANYHMPRSLEEFGEVTDGVAIIPAPVFPDNFTLTDWWSHTESRILLLSEYHKFLAAKLRHWLLFATRR
ncbi:MAG: YdcF family protein [Pseudomonadota bacterium]|nr:YdcF family protein [Pseudomonadota bacterium]